MSQVSAAQVKALRERTGVGMMECKKALVEAGGDLEAAVEAMRKSGLAAADRKAGRVAADGIIVVAGEGARGAMVEVNCETDFVAREEEFGEFARQIAQLALENGVEDADALSALSLGGDGPTVDERRRELVARIGENISVRRCALLEAADGQVANYVHGGRIGVLVSLEGGGGDVATLGRDIAMHVAASRPLGVDENDLPAETLERERGIAVAQAEATGKPPEIAEKIATGRLRKFVDESTLLGQKFVKNPDVSVGAHLSAEGNGATVRRFVRFEVGEGIERREDDFVSEVMAQVRGNA